MLTYHIFSPHCANLQNPSTNLREKRHRFSAILGLCLMVIDMFMKAWLTVTRLTKVAEAVTDLWRLVGFNRGEQVLIDKDL